MSGTGTDAKGGLSPWPVSEASIREYEGPTLRDHLDLALPDERAAS
ncbi:hypothetical protein OHA71_47915 [Streptomyces sp. NBC_00444]